LKKDAAPTGLEKRRRDYGRLTQGSGLTASTSGLSHTATLWLKSTSIGAEIIQETCGTPH
jgi:hypothetical protein